MLFGKDKASKVLRDKLGLTVAQSEETYDTFMAMLKEAADNDDSVRLPGIGTLKRNEIEAHEATNPGTGEKVNVPNRFNYKLKSPTQDAE